MGLSASFIDMTAPPSLPRSFTAFDGGRLIAAGSLSEVALAMVRAGIGDSPTTALIFDDRTGGVIDFHLQGSPDEIEARAARQVAALQGTPGAPSPRRGPGRPRLGVVSRELTLLPRHWAWLAAQRGGASATVRRLVDEARRRSEGQDRVRSAQDATYRFLSAAAGDYPGYEEAIRALFRSDGPAFEARIADWPDDLRAYTLRLAAPALKSAEGDASATTRSANDGAAASPPPASRG